jgi:hypothetical protein
VRERWPYYDVERPEEVAMRHGRHGVVRFRKVRLLAFGAVAALALSACGSASGAPKAPAGQSPTPTTASSSGGYNY